MTIDIPDTLARNPWFKVVEMLQQNWAVVVPENQTFRAVFYDDTCGVFDEISFPSQEEAEAALHRNGFAKILGDPLASEFISIPIGKFRRVEHPNGPIYSSGRFWH